jgi:predicted DNA-binding transcriptional regulator AlpA
MPALPDSFAPEVESVTLISPRRCSEISSLSMRELDRLEAKGKYPRSVKLGEGRNGRKARALAEVLEWNRTKMAARR